MDDRCPQGTQPAHTTVGKAQASSPRDPREEPSEKIKIQDKLSYSSHSENVGKASKKKERREGEGQYCCQGQAWKESTTATGVPTSKGLTSLLLGT